MLWQKKNNFNLLPRPINSGWCGGLDRLTSAAAWKEVMAVFVNKNCIVCGINFSVRLSQVKSGKGRCCSHSCAASLSCINRDQSGAANNNWKGGSDNTGRKRRYREANPQKHTAHLVVRNALRKGDLQRGACEVCGEGKTEGHHNDYSRPLLVNWLCKKHHLSAHKGRFF